MTSILNYITWDVSRFIYVGEDVTISWYWVMWTLGLVGMLITLLVTFKHDGVPTYKALITFVVATVFIMVFGHLVHGLFYEWTYWPENPVHFLGTDWSYRNYFFDEPHAFLEFSGGYASHGMALGVILTGVILSKYIKRNMWWIVDRCIMGFMILAITVRIGNFFNSEIYGIETTLPWGVIFPGESAPAHPTQFYEMASYVIALAIGWGLYLKFDEGKYNGLITSEIFLVTMAARILIEFVKLPQKPIEQSWLLDMGQWLSIPYIIWMSWLLFHSLRAGRTIE